jgi:hypothetical protein
MGSRPLKRGQKRIRGVSALRDGQELSLPIAKERQAAKRQAGGLRQSKARGPRRIHKQQSPGLRRARPTRSHNLALSARNFQGISRKGSFCLAGSLYFCHSHDRKCRCVRSYWRPRSRRKDLRGTLDGRARHLGNMGEELRRTG